MWYFVTGATGFVGGRIAGQRREAGHNAVALASDPAQATSLRETLAWEMRQLGLPLPPGLVA